MLLPSIGAGQVGRHWFGIVIYPYYRSFKAFRFAVCLRTDNYYFRFLKLFNFGLMYNIGLGAIRAEGRSTRQ